MAWRLERGVGGDRRVPCSPASHLGVRCPQRAASALLAHPQMAGAAALTSSHQGSMSVSHQAAVRRAGPGPTGARLCHPFHHCRGPWHSAFSQLSSWVTGRSRPQKQRWVRTGSGIHHPRQEPRTISLRLSRPDDTHCHGNGLLTYLHKGATLTDSRGP